MEAIRTLNQELIAKTKALAEETHQLVEVEKAKTNLVTKLAALREQMEKARADAMAEFRISQPFFNACDVYCDEEFEDCLKQVKAIHPNLDLSQIAIDDTVLPMPRGEDTISDETVDFVHTIEQEVEIDGMVIAQPALCDPNRIVISFAENPTTADDLPIVNPNVPDAPSS